MLPSKVRFEFYMALSRSTNPYKAMKMAENLYNNGYTVSRSIEAALHFYPLA